MAAKKDRTISPPVQASAAKPLSQKSDAELKREARARLRHIDPAEAAELVNEVVSKQVSGSVNGFVNFLRENGITGLAVGFVVGTQVQGLVKQLIASFIDPLSVLLFGKALSSRTFTLHFDHKSADFGWGAFVYMLIDFLFVLIVIYAIIKFFKLDKLDKPKA
jgi:large-conductance mechanosensitive channel